MNHAQHSVRNVLSLLINVVLSRFFFVNSLVASELHFGNSVTKHFSLGTVLNFTNMSESMFFVLF